MKKYIFFSLFLFIYFPFLYSKTLSFEENFYIKRSSTDLGSIYDALTYLNYLRKSAGLISLKENQLLDEAAYNHAQYLIYNNVASHYEEEGNDYFTGVTPTDRAHFVGYNGNVSENINFGGNNFDIAIDNLFSAIYHRLGFLDFQIDEVGIAGLYSENYYYKTVYVFEMGNSYLRELCEQSTYDGEGIYYFNVCIDPEKKIPAELYDNITNYFYSIAPEYVIWPYINATEVSPVFYDEIPDPLPSCNVTGYPISIQFNPNKIDIDSLKLIDFKIFDENFKEITDTILLTKDNDPNNRLTNGEFVLFPKTRLEWGKKYFVKIVYEENNIEKTINWSFFTKNLNYPYFVANNSSSNFYIISNQDYYIYFPPADCNDRITTINYTYSNLTINEINFLDYNTIHVNLSGNNGGTFTLTTSNNKEVTLTISDDDNAIYPLQNFSILQGWNLYGLPYFVENGISPDKYFNYSEINSIWKWNNNHWEIWSPLQIIKELISKYGLEQISQIYSGDGFWINSEKNITIQIPGLNDYGLESIEISSGWNLKGIGKQINVNDLFNAFDNIKIVWIWKNNTWLINSNDELLKDLAQTYNISIFDTIEKGAGFWVYKENEK